MVHPQRFARVLDHPRNRATDRSRQCDGRTQPRPLLTELPAAPAGLPLHPYRATKAPRSNTASTLSNPYGLCVM